MPKSVHALTPLEKKLRRHAMLRAMGHEPQALNCYWSKKGDTWAKKGVCKPCRELRIQLGLKF